MDPIVHSSLHTPDDVHCHLEREYSRDVARGLGRAHQSIRHALATSQRFDAARRELLPLLSLPMCRHQRLRAYYLFGMVMAREGDHAPALQRLDAALDLAHDVGDPGAIAEIAHLRAGVHRSLCEFAKEAEYQILCLQTLRALSPDGQSVDPGLELACLVDLAAARTMLADFEGAAWCLREAEEMARKVAGAPLDKAFIAWIQALVYRYQGTPMRALIPAMDACEAYVSAASPSALSRIQTVIADIAIDAAETSHADPSSTAHVAMLGVAARYLGPARKNARAAKDRAGEGLALLSYCRFDRLTRRKVDRFGMLESVFATADALADKGLRGQAYIVLGQELAHRGASTDMVIRCYERAVDALARTDMYAIELLAWRALLLAQEMRTGS